MIHALQQVNAALAMIATFAAVTLFAAGIPGLLITLALKVVGASQFGGKP